MWVLGQVFINVGYVVGLLPVTGLQLPLISAGGTSTATTLLIIGVDRERGPARARGGRRAARGPRRPGQPAAAAAAARAVRRRPGLEALRDRLRPTAGQARPSQAQPSASPSRSDNRAQTPCGRPARATLRASWRRPTRSAEATGQRHQGRRAQRYWKVNGHRGQELATGGSPWSSPVAAPRATSNPRWPWPMRSWRSTRDVRITALGTERGLETRLVPERGYDLELITPVPLPRKPIGDLVRLPLRVRRAVRQTRAVLDDVDADVVIGFGGYVALPAYLAARGGALAPSPGARRHPRGQRQRGLGQPGRRPVGATGALRGPRPGAARAPRSSASRCARRSRRWTGSALRAEARAHFGFADDATGAAGVRRLAGRAVDQPGRRAPPPKSLPQQVSRCCTRTVRRTSSSCASPQTAIRRTSRCRT